MSHDIQNEIIQTITSNQITCDITANIRNNFYSIICDEQSDIQNKEQLSFCIRRVDKFLVAHEEFFGFYEVPNIKKKHLLRLSKKFSHVFSCHYNQAVDNALMVPVTCSEKGLVLSFKFTKRNRKPITLLTATGTL